MSANITLALVTAGFIVSMYFAGRMAEHRGRSFRIWAWIAAFIGPLALPLVLLLPDLHGKNRDHAWARARSDTRQGGPTNLSPFACAAPRPETGQNIRHRSPPRKSPI